jgi:putative transposase
MTLQDAFEGGWFYHIYNHGNGNDVIFRTNENYRYFMRKYQHYMSPIWETYSWCLMPNHFHLLIQVKNIEGLTPEEIHKQSWQRFSHFTNGYAQAFNKQEKRRGSLFMQSFKRIRVEDENYLLNLVRYIHLNPVAHGFRNHPYDWQFSSWRSFVEQPGDRGNAEIISLFGGKENFLAFHREKAEERNAFFEAQLRDDASSAAA